MIAKEDDPFLEERREKIRRAEKRAKEITAATQKGIPRLEESEEPPKPVDADALIESMQTALQARLSPPVEPDVWYLELKTGIYFHDANKTTSNPDVSPRMDSNLANKVLQRILGQYPKSRLRRGLDVWWSTAPLTKLEEVGYPEVLPAIRAAITQALADSVSREDIKKFVLEVLHDNKE
jgi:hypothetical protein